MKSITKLFLVLFAAISCFGCEKIENDNNDNNDNNKGQNTQEDFYYVRFEVGASYGFSDVTISLTGCESFSKYGAMTTFSEVLGPASKGAVAKITIGSGICTSSIYVSKNNGPFALKRQGTSSSLSYTINF